MNSDLDSSDSPSPVAGSSANSSSPLGSATPLSWRLAIALGIILVGSLSFFLRESLGPSMQSGLGAVCLIGLVALFSGNLRRVNWRTIGWGLALQLLLAFLILKVKVVYMFFETLGGAIKQFLAFSDEGARFVFGPLADPQALEKAFGPTNKFIFAFSALPPIIFVSSFFTVLFYLGVLQFIVRLMARAMIYLMGTSGAESLSTAANVFMGQTEAPLIVKPYVARMTQSELLALMVGGMATISGGIMAIYIRLGADQVAILATSVMAAPASLYLSKLLLPETEEPETRGIVKTPREKPHRNLIDAAAAGASDGLFLALNVAAMLIAFLAFLAFINYMLGSLVEGLTLKVIFSRVFSPLAFLMGVEGKDVFLVADLLGTKLATNEFVAFVELTSQDYKPHLSDRSFKLATYALTGFANFASVGIQLGGIGGMAPQRRGDLARLGGRALFVGFLATLVNAAIAGMLMD